MTTAYSQTEKTYELPTLKLAPLGLVKPTPGVRADRLKPEDWRDELAGQYYYYAVAGQHNAGAARALLGTDVAVRYNFERWPARMVYFSDEDFEGYFLVSAEDNKKDLKAPPRQLELSMRDIRWCWKELGYSKAVMGNPSGRQAQVEAWRRFCSQLRGGLGANRVLRVGEAREAGMQEAVQLMKCDRILVWLWNYYQFKHENRPDNDWTTKYPFLKKQEAILAKFEGQGLDAALWDGSRKLVSDSSLFKDCPPYMGCEDDKSIKATEKLVQNKKLPIDWKNKVLSVLTGSRSKSMEVALAERMVHILWNDSKDVTTITPFGVDPLDVQMKVVELERAVGIMKCHTCVLDLCEPVNIKQWTAKVFESLNALLEHLFPSHWIVVAFVPREHDYYFMTSLHHLSVVKAMAGKWVRRTQQKKSFGVGHNLYALDDRIYILFKGDDLWENTCVVYDARLATGDAPAVGALQKVTPTEIFHIPFDTCEWPVVIHGRDPVVYKGHERNPTISPICWNSFAKRGTASCSSGKRTHKSCERF
ncbi:hypothetical protein CBR_g45563 [Chara braunii]|uniref:Uncharacterized protein n=1 Tax=Chara braunii TaxID=69332 RepID=A0A388LYV5_CHABU|nr:hypothetical protein CBR_g45563 [Chara braunii]|eukprot:GBG87504.1 hypothetical protein CBR_g45563 [Chara braunii]